MSRKKRHEESHADERWVISYADLVTLLFGFFLLLYATADANAVKFAELSRGLAEAFHVPIKDADSAGSIFEGGTGIVPGRNSPSIIEDDLAFIRSAVSRESLAAGVQGQIQVSREDNHIVLRLSDQLIFPSASADIRLQALPVLDVVARSIGALPNEVRIEGHTDNVPVGTDRYPTNWELSSARATSVLRYLVEQAGVDAGRVFAAGFGAERPIATNLTPEGRALNRRADIVLLYPVLRLTGVESTTAGADGPVLQAAPEPVTGPALQAAPEPATDTTADTTPGFIPEPGEQE